MSDQREFFRDVEREYWTEAEGLKAEEMALAERYLDPTKSTVDAGTGGGRVARALAAAGYTRMSGFDFTPELIEAARAADPEGSVDFTVADATDLPYPDASFGQALYLQQVISTIDDPAGREGALAEAARILAPSGTAIFSFVCLESRLSSPAQRTYVAYLRAARKLRHDTRPVQSMPRLRLSGRADASGALRDRGPYNWWYRAEEIERDLTHAGLSVEAIGFGAAAEAGTLSESAKEALVQGAGGTLYAVCRKLES
ncbi:MAG: class I SAM-dependent methyltransferase [Actinomycetota bacterium]|nr:class I SAM-dependent methyltransferase [Actinomycetota bacterium]